MKESTIQRSVIAWLKNRGWYVKKNNDRYFHGEPDFYAIKNSVVIWFEVKRPGGVLSRIQEKVIRDMRNHGALVFVVRSVEDVESAIEVVEAGNVEFYETHRATQAVVQ